MPNHDKKAAYERVSSMVVRSIELVVPNWGIRSMPDKSSTEVSDAQTLYAVLKSRPSSTDVVSSILGRHDVLVLFRGATALLHLSPILDN